MATTTVAGLAPVYSPITRINFHKKPHLLLLSYNQNPILTTLQHRPRTVLLAIEEEGPRKQKNREQVGCVDIKLPRRSLQVEFSCNSCGERTKRLINRLAYERGLVFVQCSGCLKHHKLVDNLGLIVEYDFRKETSNKDSSTDHI